MGGRVGERDGTDFKRTHYQNFCSIGSERTVAGSVNPAPLIDKAFLLLFVHKKKILPALQPIDLTNYP